MINVKHINELSHLCKLDIDSAFKRDFRKVFRAILGEVTRGGDTVSVDFYSDSEELCEILKGKLESAYGFAVNVHNYTLYISWENWVVEQFERNVVKLPPLVDKTLVKELNEVTKGKVSQEKVVVEHDTLDTVNKVIVAELLKKAESGQFSAVLDLDKFSSSEIGMIRDYLLKNGLRTSRFQMQSKDLLVSWCDV